MPIMKDFVRMNRVFCDVCGGDLISHDLELTTMVGYASPKGHNHDDNCVRRQYTCENGHKTIISKQNRCPVVGCEWVGKTTCFCHHGIKVDEWPDGTILDGEVINLIRNSRGSQSDF